MRMAFYHRLVLSIQWLQKLVRLQKSVFREFNPFFPADPFKCHQVGRELSEQPSSGLLTDVLWVQVTVTVAEHLICVWQHSLLSDQSHCPCCSDALHSMMPFHCRDYISRWWAVVLDECSLAGCPIPTENLWSWIEVGAQITVIQPIHVKTRHHYKPWWCLCNVKRTAGHGNVSNPGERLLQHQTDLEAENCSKSESKPNCTDAAADVADFADVSS